MTDEEFEKYIEELDAKIKLASEGLPSIEEVNMAILEQIAESIEITPRNEMLISNSVLLISEQEDPEIMKRSNELYKELHPDMYNIVDLDKIEEYYRSFPEIGKISGN